MDREVQQPTSAVPDKVANLNAARGGQGRPRLPRPISKVTSRSDDARPGRATRSGQVRVRSGLLLGRSLGPCESQGSLCCLRAPSLEIELRSNSDIALHLTSKP
jgi:hypothetical protein